jgi:hypothetical protein
MQGPFAELRADDEVENAGAELIADALHLCEHGVRTADNHRAEGDAVGEIASRRAAAAPWNRRRNSPIAFQYVATVQAVTDETCQQPLMTTSSDRSGPTLQEISTLPFCLFIVNNR